MSRRLFRDLRLCLLLLIVSGIFAVSNLQGAKTPEEFVEKKYPINADAALSIQNAEGAVRIYAGDVTEITIKALKRALTADRLKQIAVEVKAAPETVEIQTKLPSKRSGLSMEDRSGTVDYTIVVPFKTRISRLDLSTGEVLLEGLRGGSVTAKVGDGWLVARNCFSDMKLNLKNGRLEAVYDFWEPISFRAELTSPEGNIRTYFTPDASFDVVARTASGRILNWLGQVENDPRKPVRTLDFAVGSAPPAKFEMRSESGDIRILKAW